MTIAEMEARLLALPEMIADAEVEYKRVKSIADAGELEISLATVTTGKDADTRKMERENAVLKNDLQCEAMLGAANAEAKYHALVREYDAITTILRRGA